MKEFINKNKKVAKEAVFIGSTVAAGTGFIIWIFELLSMVIPGAAAAFLAGIFVPVINYYINKILEK